MNTIEKVANRQLPKDGEGVLPPLSHSTATAPLVSAGLVAAAVVVLFAAGVASDAVENATEERVDAGDLDPSTLTAGQLLAERQSGLHA